MHDLPNDDDFFVDYLQALKGQTHYKVERHRRRESGREELSGLEAFMQPPQPQSEQNEQGVLLDQIGQVANGVEQANHEIDVSDHELAQLIERRSELHDRENQQGLDPLIRFWRERAATLRGIRNELYESIVLLAETLLRSGLQAATHHAPTPPDPPEVHMEATSEDQAGVTLDELHGDPSAWTGGDAHQPSGFDDGFPQPDPGLIDDLLAPVGP